MKKKIAGVTLKKKIKIAPATKRGIAAHPPEELTLASLLRAQSPVAVRQWRQWNHDLDTLLHELVKNPALADADPAMLVARAEAFADALRAMQDRRRPPGVLPEADV